MPTQVDLDALVEAMANGQPIVLLDSPTREGEADMIVHASFCDWKMMRRLRQDAGGWICLATDQPTAKVLGLEFMADLLRATGKPALSKLAIGKTPYGDPSPFSIYINHRSTYTGIPDGDRAKTITAFARLVGEKQAPRKMQQAFVDQFYAPGHVPLLIASPLEKRRGHTELAMSIAKTGGLAPAVVLCEMMGDDGKALSWEKAQAYAKKGGLLSIDGKTLLNLLKQG